MKVCKRCLECKPLDAFSPSKLGKLGCYPECRACRREIYREQTEEKRQARLAMRCVGCGGAVLVPKTGAVPRYCAEACRWKTDPEFIEARRQQERRYQAKPNGAEARRRGDRASYARKKDALPDFMVANRLKMRIADVPPHLLELKRQQLITYRLARQLKEATRESS